MGNTKEKKVGMKNNDNTDSRKKGYFSNDCVPPVRKKTIEDGSGIFWDTDLPINHPEWFAICPLDGRYVQVEDQLSAYFSEYALVKYRVYVEFQWLSFLISNEIVNHPYSVEEYDSFFENFKFDLSSMKRVKEIESKIKHDVKSVELYIAEELKHHGLEKLIPYVHLGCTSEDITSCAYALMIKDCMEYVWKPKAIEVIQKLKKLSHKYANISMLSHTHGQAATPTTVGKELAVFIYRLEKAVDHCEYINVPAKFGGATGNHAAISIAYPEENWPNNMYDFVTYWLGISFNPLTTQIESHDDLCLKLYAINHFNNVMLDLQWDMWTYICLEYFKQIPVADEVGSSTMPQKVNPINFENGMGNVAMSNAICSGIANKLPIARMQRDLSDSTVQRNIGMAIGYSVQAMEETLKGLNKIAVNESKLANDLDMHWDVIGEAIQTVLRKNGDSEAYNKLKELTRGKTITEEIMKTFIESLDIPAEDKTKLLQLTPAKYIGYSSSLVDLII